MPTALQTPQGRAGRSPSPTWKPHPVCKALTTSFLSLFLVAETANRGSESKHLHSPLLEWVPCPTSPRQSLPVNSDHIQAKHAWFSSTTMAWGRDDRPYCPEESKAPTDRGPHSPRHDHRGSPRTEAGCRTQPFLSTSAFPWRSKMPPILKSCQKQGMDSGFPSLSSECLEPVLGHPGPGCGSPAHTIPRDAKSQPPKTGIHMPGHSRVFTSQPANPRVTAQKQCSEHRIYQNFLNELPLQ